MRNHWLTGGMALALCAIPMSATAQAAPTKSEKPVSPFILCDGHTGHVGLAATLGRLALLTATAGLSETVTATDDETRRLNGTKAAEACDEALSQEHDNLRRAQLATAKAIHLTEAGKLDDALAAAGAVSSAAGPLAQEWGYQRSFAPRVLLLEAAIQVRRKNAEAAEAAAVQALSLAPFDVALTKRAARYLNLGAGMGAAKDSALLRAVRLMPDLISIRAAALIKMGRFSDAYDALTAAEDLLVPFYNDFHPEEFDAHRALLLALADRGAESDALAAKVQNSLSSQAGTGFMVQNASIVAEASEYLSMRALLRDLAAGQGKEARATFRAHGPWLLISRGIVPVAVDRLRAGATPNELTGTLAEPGATLRARSLAENLSALSDPKGMSAEYQQPFFYASTADFAKVANATWKVGEKPKFLVKHDKDQLPSTDVLDSLPNVDGLPAGEALLLHAALIAKTRGLQGFVMKPGREYTAVTGLRFGNIGDPGMPAMFAFNADAVIDDIAPHIPEPIPGS